MKILRVVSDLYPFVAGGIGIHAHQMSSLQARSGHAVTVFTLRPKKPLAPDLSRDYDITFFPAYFTLWGNSFAPGLVRAIFKHSGDFDIIHAHSHLFFSTNICVLARLFHRVPLIITSHGLISASTPEWLNTLYKKTISRVSFCIADHIICYTETEKKTIEALGIDPEKISVIHNGVDTTLFAPDGRKQSKKDHQILWVGRYVPGKGVEYLIEAFFQVRCKIPDARLVLVGEGPGKKAVEDRLRELQVTSSVTFIDYVDNADLPAIYNQSAVFVLPSIMEGMPRTLLEAMACGIPVVTTNLDHLAALVDGAGYTVPSRDPQLLAEKLVSLLEDETFATEMGQKGSEIIRTGYSWEDTVNLTLAVYEGVKRES
jgi:glycosyltransferase involved in cell wall biosynthesis